MGESLVYVLNLLFTDGAKKNTMIKKPLLFRQYQVIIDCM